MASEVAGGAGGASAAGAAAWAAAAAPSSPSAPTTDSSQLRSDTWSRRKRVTITVLPSTSSTSRMRLRSSSERRAIIPASDTASRAAEGSISWTMTTVPDDANAWDVATAPPLTFRIT